MIGIEVGTNEHVSQAESGYTPRLSPRQQSILHCLIQGDSNKAIARKMAITEATVKVHVKAILRRIQVHNRTQAAIWAMSNGPFFSAKNDASPALGDLSMEQFPSLDAAQVLSEGHKNGSASLPTLKHKGANGVALSSIVRHVRGNGRKSD